MANDLTGNVGLFMGWCLKRIGKLIGLQQNLIRSTGFRKDLTVLFLVSHNSAGGTQEVCRNIVEGFWARGHEALLFALYPGDFDRNSSVLPWNYVVARKPSGLFDQIQLVFGLAETIRRLKPSAVVTAMPAANVLGPIAACLSGTSCRVIVSHHSPANTHNPELNMLDSLTGSFGVTKTVICVSNTVASTLKNKPLVYRAKLQTIHNSLPPEIEEHIAGLERAPQRELGRSHRIVSTGRLGPEKNYSVLIRALALMKNVELLIVGKGSEQNALERLAQELGVTDDVKFLGQMPRLDVLTTMSKCDVFVQPSLFEGHSLSLIEASKLGMPLVISNVPGQLEGATRADGVLCAIALDPHDAHGFAREISKLFSDSSYFQAWTERSRLLSQQSNYGDMITQYERVVVPLLRDAVLKID